MRHIQKLAITKKSTFFVLSSWNLVKIIISFTKFHEESIKNVDFLLMANFWRCLVFLPRLYMTVCDYKIISENLKIHILMWKQQINALYLSVIDTWTFAVYKIRKRYLLKLIRWKSLEDNYRWNSIFSPFVYLAGALEHMWTWGLVHTIFWDKPLKMSYFRM